MGNDMNKIMPGLFIGNFHDSQDVKQIKANEITHILSIHDEAKSGVFKDIKYKCIDLPDSEGQNILQYISECVAFVHRARISGGNVLVHCLAGVSRSSTICIAYIMTISNLDYKPALQVVKNARRIARPNGGFRMQIRVYQGLELLTVRERLIGLFGEFDQSDIEYINNVLSKYEPTNSSAKYKKLPTISISGNGPAPLPPDTEEGEPVLDSTLDPPDFIEAVEDSVIADDGIKEFPPF